MRETHEYRFTVPRIVKQSDTTVTIDYGGFTVSWMAVRGYEYQIDWYKPAIWFTIGMKDSGKSSLLEFIATRYLNHGGSVLDLNGSTDGEGLAWLRSPYLKRGRFAVLKSPKVDVTVPGEIPVIKSRRIEVDGEEGVVSVETETEMAKADVAVLDADQFDVSLLEEFKVIVNPAPFYLSKEEELMYGRRILESLSRRLSWSRVCAVIFREGQDYFYSRSKAREEQKLVKGHAAYLARESRHMGCAFLVDAQKYKTIDDDLRYIADYILIKNQGGESLPPELHYIYSLVKTPATLNNLRRDEVFIKTKEGQFGWSSTPYPAWHKLEQENLLAALGVRVAYRDEEVDEEEANIHANIVYEYYEGEAIGAIAGLYGVSNTRVQSEIARHNRALRNGGACPLCDAAGSPVSRSEVRVRHRWAKNNDDGEEEEGGE